jgi:hypothetical protein
MLAPLRFRTTVNGVMSQLQTRGLNYIRLQYADCCVSCRGLRFCTSGSRMILAFSYGRLRRALTSWPCFATATTQARWGLPTSQERDSGGKGKARGFVSHKLSRSRPTSASPLHAESSVEFDATRLWPPIWKSLYHQLSAQRREYMEWLYFCLLTSNQ